MIHRRIFKVKTVGSRAEGDLRPEFTDDFVSRYGTGINYRVLEYNEEEGWCVVECWCCDHPIVEPEHRKNMTHLFALDKDPSVLEVLPSHPKSPPVLACLATSTHESVDEEKKEIVVKGRRGSFKRKERHTTTDGTEEDLYILDEG
jgi:hypothetical protein